MTDYTTITNAQVQPKAPVTSELVTALRDNPTAITEGSIGAPRNTWASFGTTVAGATTHGVFSSTVTTGTGETTLQNLVATQPGEIRFTVTGGGVATLRVKIAGVTVLTGVSGSTVDATVATGDTIVATSAGQTGVPCTLAFATDNSVEFVFPVKLGPV